MTLFELELTAPWLTTALSAAWLEATLPPAARDDERLMKADEEM